MRAEFKDRLGRPLRVGDVVLWPRERGDYYVVEERQSGEWCMEPAPRSRPWLRERGCDCFGESTLVGRVETWRRRLALIERREVIRTYLAEHRELRAENASHAFEVLTRVSKSEPLANRLRLPKPNELSYGPRLWDAMSTPDTVCFEDELRGIKDKLDEIDKETFKRRRTCLKK